MLQDHTEKTIKIVLILDKATVEMLQVNILWLICVLCFESTSTCNTVKLSSFYFEETNHLSLVMRKLAFCICENKDADQLRSNREADQRLCFRYMDSTIPILSKSEISSL